jgi:Holliday junction DNA helicase RuvA
MITLLTGKLIEKSLTRAVLDVQGVGYELFIPMSTYDKLPKIGDSVCLKTIMHVREDLISLYGFFSDDERQLYKLVCSVSGIGPKIALSVLSCMTVKSFCVNVMNKDVSAIAQINGIGKRTAERLVVDLVDKIHKVSPEVALSGKSGEEKDAALASSVAAEDAISGLITLGIKADAARKTVHKLIEENDRPSSADKLIRQALNAING